MIHYRKVIPAFILTASLAALCAGQVHAEEECMTGHEHQHEHFAKQMEQHHKMLHDALKLAPEQEAGWKKLLESEHPGPMGGPGQHEDWSKLTAPERAEKRFELAKVRQEQMGEHLTVLKGFYASLSPEQKKTFDDFHSGPRGGMRGKMAQHPGKTDKQPAKP